MSAARWFTHFGLSEMPFSKDIEDKDLWLPSSREQIVDGVVNALSDHHHVMLVGEPGDGKTCVLRAVRHRLPTAGFRLTYCHNATLGRRDFYRQLCVSLGLQPKATAASVFYAISTHVESLGREHVHPVFLIDEAHLLQQEVLDHLHVLANYEWDSKPLLSLVLVGLADLRDRIALHKNRSLWSRIQTRLAIAEPTPEDTVEYIAYRMKRAGATREIFTSDALALLHEGATGHLRDVDRLATEALKLASRRKLKLVDRDLIQHVANADGRPELS
jgi:type II secretory pathway predicted ATPase ExeA